MTARKGMELPFYVGDIPAIFWEIQDDLLEAKESLNLGLVKGIKALDCRTFRKSESTVGATLCVESADSGDFLLVPFKPYPQSHVPSSTNCPLPAIDLSDFPHAIKL
jgi:hypothetical protein